MSLGPPPSSFVRSHRPKCGIRHLPNVLNFFFSFPFGLFCFLEERQMTEQREGWPSQSWSRCSTGSPNKHILVQGQRGGGCWPTPLPCPWPPCCSPVRRAAGQRLPWARVVMVLRPLPAAQRGKKNAEPGKSPSVSSGVEGAGRDRAGAARAWLALLWHWWREGCTSGPLGLVLSACPWHSTTASMCSLVPPCYITLI